MAHRSMRRKQIPQAGRRHLEHIATASGELGRLGEWLGEYRFREDCLDDGYVWLTCVLAAEGVSTGNAGVGCIMTDSEGDVVAEGHNEVFAPPLSQRSSRRDGRGQQV